MQSEYGHHFVIWVENRGWHTNSFWMRDGFVVFELKDQRRMLVPLTSVQYIEEEKDR